MVQKLAGGTNVASSEKPSACPPWRILRTNRTRKVQARDCFFHNMLCYYQDANDTLLCIIYAYYVAHGSWELWRACSTPKRCGQYGTFRVYAEACSWSLCTVLKSQANFCQLERATSTWTWGTCHLDWTFCSNLVVVKVQPDQKQGVLWFPSDPQFFT